MYVLAEFIFCRLHGFFLYYPPMHRDTVVKLIYARVIESIPAGVSFLNFIVKTFPKNSKVPLAGIELDIECLVSKRIVTTALQLTSTTLGHISCIINIEFTLFEHITYLFCPPQRKCLRILLTEFVHLVHYETYVWECF